MAMNRRTAIKAIAFGAAAWVGTRPLFGKQTAHRPNVVLFLTDDHGWWDSTPYGATDVRTPNMQRLADAGVIFTHAFVPSPSCAPCRGAMLTGLMPARNGAEANHTFPRDGIKTLPAYLHDVGYEVAAFGKVAHGRDVGRHGFDHHDARYDADRVAAYLRGRNPANPLCLFVGTHEPHVPWAEEHTYDPAALSLPPTHVDTPQTRELRARYYQDVTQADTELGAIYDLARKHLGPDVLFIYTSDHGAQWPFAKWNLYDAGIRSPLLAAWPGVIKPHALSTAMVSWIDLLPTLVELAGGTPPRGIDGRSFAGVLRGRTDTHRDRIFATHSGDGRMNIYPMRALRTQQYKYILNLHPEFAHTTHIDQARGKDGLIYWLSWVNRGKADPAAAAIVNRYHRRPREELYDLQADPHELRNLADDPKHADRLAGFRTELQAWMAQQGDTRTVFAEPRLLADPASWAPASLQGTTGTGIAVPKAVWRYTTESPSDGWEKPGFDAGGWKEGPGGFGRIRQPAARVGTPWQTADIWLRRTVRLKKAPARPALLVFHDEDAEVYLNGVRVAVFSGHTRHYVTKPLDARGRKALKPGENLLAVHCRQTTGGQFIDVHVIDAAR